MRRYVGISNRNARQDPVRHIFTHRRASRTGRNAKAWCGTSINPSIYRDADGPVLFDPDHPRACPACAKADP